MPSTKLSRYFRNFQNFLHSNDIIQLRNRVNPQKIQSMKQENSGKFAVGFSINNNLICYIAGPKVIKISRHSVIYT